MVRGGLASGPGAPAGARDAGGVSRRIPLGVRSERGATRCSIKATTHMVPQHERPCALSSVGIPAEPETPFAACSQAAVCGDLSILAASEPFLTCRSAIAAFASGRDAAPCPECAVAGIAQANDSMTTSAVAFNAVARVPNGVTQFADSPDDHASMWPPIWEGQWSDDALALFGYRSPVGWRRFAGANCRHQPGAREPASPLARVAKPSGHHASRVRATSIDKVVAERAPKLYIKGISAMIVF